MKRAWLLNLDAERELASRAPSDPFAATEARPELAPLLDALVGGDRVLRRSCRGVAAVGLAWCPTPGAIAALERAGVTVRPSPPLEVLRAVNHRAFSAKLGGALEGSVFATTVEEALAALHRESPSGTWLLKRPLGFAGRGRALAPPVTEGVRRFVEGAVAREGGVAIEPLVERDLDVSIHGYLDAAGVLTRGAPTVSTVSRTGTWAGSRCAGAEITAREATALDDELTRVAAALKGAGYFGPFGVDGFRYRVGAAVRFHARCEINARYTMGWAVGMAGKRPDLD